MERYIAIDNVCAWPNLTSLPDGTVVATIFNQPCHGRWEGDVECWASEDGGRFWRLRGTPAPHEPGTNRMNVAAGLAANGDLVVIASGWSHRPRKGETPAGHAPPAHPLPPWVCRSGDGGRTWTRTSTLSAPEGRSPRIMPFGAIVQLQDGTLGVCLYSWAPPDTYNSDFYTSADDGRILLSYGDRRPGHYGIEARLSDDAGRTGGAPRRLVALEEADLGYPSTVPLADGRLLTAWYCSGIAAHQRYHMGTLIWELKEI